MQSFTSPCVKLCEKVCVIENKSASTTRLGNIGNECYENYPIFKSAFFFFSFLNRILLHKNN